MVLGEKNLSHLRRCGILEEDSTQRLRTGLIFASPPALEEKIWVTVRRSWIESRRGKQSVLT